MKKIKTLILYIFSVLMATGIFFVGRWTAPDGSKEIQKKYELERKYHINEITKLNAALEDRDKIGQQIIKRMYDDSVKAANELRSKDRVILKQKRENEKINLSRSSVAELDSIRAVILRAVN
jgi:hypothetical protein